MIKKKENNFLQKAAVVLLLGEPRQITPASALQLRVGRLVWGKDTGLTSGGVPVELPDEIFYTINDRSIHSEAKAMVMLNLVRSQMVEIEHRRIKAILIGLCLLSIIFFGSVAGVNVIKIAYQNHEMQVNAQSQMQRLQQSQSLGQQVNY
jgi:hypothetical protein